MIQYLLRASILANANPVISNGKWKMLEAFLNNFAFAFTSSCSHWLKTWKMKDFRLRFLAVEMREHNFMGKQRCPFKSCVSISISSAQKFVLAIGEFNEFSLTKLLNDFGLIA